MPATLNNTSLVHHQNHIGILNGGETMGDGYRRPSFAQGDQSLLNILLGFTIDIGGGLISNKKRGLWAMCAQKSNCRSPVERD